MAEAYIFDALRTPRGKGKQGGALNQATPIHLAATALRALRERNQLDTSKVDDVVLGCVEPVGEQGADIARVAALYAPLYPVVQRVDIRTAEMIKYASNSVLATLISFSNEIGRLCSAVGDIDVAEVMRGVHEAAYLAFCDPPRAVR